MNAMPQLTEQHRRMETLIGRWVGEEKLHPTPWDPQGGPATARVDNRLALDGFAVVQDYEQERNGKVSFRGHAVFRCDGNGYAMHWFDSMGMEPSIFRGNFEGDVLTLTSRSPQGTSRAVFDFSQHGSYVFRMDVSPDGNQWFPFLEGQYRRQ